MAFDVMVPLKEALEQVTYDNAVRVVVLTGAGKGFSSGADHKSAGSVPNVDGLTRPTYALRSMEVLDDVILALRKLHQPVIGAINGAAIGGVFCLSLAFDIRVASEAAYFRAAGINNGLSSTELGLSYLLPRAIGSSRAFEIMLTGRDETALNAVADAIRKAGRRAAVAVVDLRKPDAPAKLVEQVQRELGGLDILVNNAGATKRGDFLELTDADWDDGYALKFFAHVRLARAAWPILKARRGSIVAIGGTGGRKPTEEFTIGSSVNAAVAA